jgi:dTDP-4-dehydrorhamnose reductase
VKSFELASEVFFCYERSERSSVKILITGSNGQLGMDCQAVLKPSHTVLAVDVEDLDITDAKSVRNAVAGMRPDLVINCAAFTQVDACETKQDIARKVNVDGPENLALAVSETGGRLFHISTDYVFDGAKPVTEPYTVADATGPLSVYGKTKLDGEAAVRSGCPRHAIIRTAWLYGVHGKNILKTFLRLALERGEQPIHVVCDQFGSPTWSYRLALQIEKLAQTELQGTFHATAEGYCSWFELAAYYLHRMDVPHNVVPCSTAQYPTPAKRPANSILENRRLKEAGINVMAHWKDDVDRFVTAYRQQLMKEAKQK